MSDETKQPQPSDSPIQFYTNGSVCMLVWDSELDRWCVPGPGRGSYLADYTEFAVERMLAELHGWWQPAPGGRVRPQKQDVERPEDMSRIGRIQTHWCDDGDVYVTVIEADSSGEEINSIASIEFCSSGGRSEHTYWALLALMRAMELDNDE